VHGTSSRPLLGQTIGDNLRQTVERHPDGDALVVVSQSFRVTYRQLYELTTRVALSLLAAGVQRGDRVGLFSPNRFEWVVVQYAAARVGAILVNINPAYRAHELLYVLVQSGTRLLFLARAFRQSSFTQLVDEVRGRCPELTECVVLDDDWSAFLERGAGVGAEQLAEREAQLGFDDPINIQYTSGTTGSPKGATLTHHNVLNNAFFVGETLGYGPGDRVCIPVPFYHCFGMVMGNLACTAHGATMVVPGEAFDPGLVLKAISTERCTSLYGVPTMFIAVLEHPELDAHDVSSLRTGIMAGSPCPVEVMRKVQARLHMHQVTICYGMTETSPVSTQSAMDDPLETRVSTVGRVHPHVEVKIVDPESGLTLPRGHPGELCTRGYSVMRGYWNNPEATRIAIDPAGWMHTGDLGTIDDDGFVRIVGRLKDMIIRGGENVYPREVEEFLLTHPAVSDAQVIGVPSQRYGEEVMAWVKPRPGMVLDEATLVEYCRGRIATYKIPRYWKLVDDFPLTVTGKVQKFRMREQSTQELGLLRPAGSLSAP
jgi:fatty-acyl-CoA synthase